MERLTKKATEYGLDEKYGYSSSGRPVQDINQQIDMYNKLGPLEDLMEKYNVSEEDIERALIVKKIIQNDSVYYEDDSREGTYYFGMELSFDFETNEIVLSEEYDDEYWSKWEEIARLPILDYKKKYWLKEDKSE